MTGLANGNSALPRKEVRNIDVSTYFDFEQGLLDRKILTDSDIYAQEQRRVFATSWLFLAHESQLAKPGDFFSTYMGTDPVIVTRDKHGQLRCFLNACRHKGMRLCRHDEGNTRNFTCNYHGWAFDTSGELVNVPAREAYPENFDQKSWGLAEVAKLETYRGLIFATWNPTAPSLVDALGGLTWYMDAFLDRDPMGTEVVHGVHKWTLEGNWKLAAEQFATDWYHVPISHASALMLTSPTGKGPKPEVLMRPGRQYHDPERGHGAGFPVHPKNRFDIDPVHKYYDYEFLRERFGEARAIGPMINGHATVFPNFSYLPSIGSIRVWHPKGTDKMEVWTWTLVDKSMPEEVKAAQRQYNLRTFGPSGIFEQDDGENWSEVQYIGGGWKTEETPLNYQMGLGTAGMDVDGYPGRTNGLFSDSGALAFYTRWAELMNTPAWHEKD